MSIIKASTTPFSGHSSASARDVGRARMFGMMRASEITSKQTTDLKWSRGDAFTPVHFCVDSRVSQRASASTMSSRVGFARGPPTTM